jgi:ubiquinone/menaquinone biosynthesis C-methylase UbiE
MLAPRRYGVIFARAPEHFRATLLRQARVSTGQIMLDVATGTGIVAEAAAQIVGHSGSVIGVDVSRGMLAVAERRLAPLRNVTIKVMDAQALDLPNASVDAITCSLAMILFPDPAQALREIYRVLRPNGYVSVSVLHSTTISHYTHQRCDRTILSRTCCRRCTVLLAV